MRFSSNLEKELRVKGENRKRRFSIQLLLALFSLFLLKEMPLPKQHLSGLKTEKRQGLTFDVCTCLAIDFTLPSARIQKEVKNIIRGGKTC